MSYTNSSVRNFVLTIVVLLFGTCMVFSQESALAKERRDYILNAFNNARKAAGLDTIVISAELSKGCNSHCKYLLINKDHPKAKGLKVHYEYPELKGYTKEGEQAAMYSEIAYCNNLQCLGNFLNTFYHRIAALDPKLSEIGIGTLSMDNYIIVVINTKKGRKKESNVDAVCYPGKDQKNVPTTMQDEMPNPVPLAKGAACGYPVTITFFSYNEVTNAIIKITDPAGKIVDCYTSSPEKPASSFEQFNTICAIAKAPLKSNTVYKVDVSCKVSGVAFKKVYSFSTN